MDEGYIKFKHKAIDDTFPELPLVEDLINLRTKLFDLNLIGVEGNVSFGNVSKRVKGNEFVITASNTGQLRVLEPKHFVIVNFVQLETNYVEYSGKMPPSSETLTHFAIYSTFQKANYVVHFHNFRIWNRFKNRIPTTPEDKTYGTVELARAVIDIKSEFRTEPKSGVIALGGHESGMLVFGDSIEIVLKEIEQILNS